MSATQAIAMASGELRVDVFGRTDVGRIREHNEDNFVVADLTSGRRTLRANDRVQTVGACGTLLGVCDGMGGAAAGEVASQIAVDTLFSEMRTGDAPEDPEELAYRLVQAVERAGLKIYEEARVDRARMGMGTTATVAALMDRRLFIAQVGDSRCYVLREGELVQVSRDQSLVNQLIEAGQLTEAEAETFEHNNIILQALGTADTVQVDLTYVDLCAGDVVLLCSDGLSGMIRGQEILDVLLQFEDPKEASRALTERANEAGGHDNITAVVARLVGGNLPAPGGDEPPPAYQKYELPVREHPTLDDSGTFQEHASEMSDEAARESRQLRVGHTMMGMKSPVLGAGLDLEPKDEAQVRQGASERRSEGLSPLVVGAFVVALLIAAALVGGYFSASQ